ncbi:MAG: hypothetical protein NC184_07770 [Roseburia sp.]|nr:hypothetical protein [Roseburia sp.]
MAIERLAGMRRYSYPLGQLDYENNTLLIRTPDVSVPEVFSSGCAGKDIGENIGLEGTFQLGWDTVALFEMNGVGFALREIRCYQRPGVYGKRSDIGIPGMTYEQVVTRAVDTATFVMLQKDNYILLAHLDMARLDDGLKDIRAFMGEDEDVNGICSYLLGRADSDERKRNEFCDALKELYPCMTSVERSCISPNGNVHFGHFEIGVCLNGEDPTLYGDVTVLSSAQLKDKVAASYLFDNVHSLRTAIEEHFEQLELGNDPGRKG